MPVLVVSHTRRKRRGAKPRQRTRHVLVRIRRRTQLKERGGDGNGRYVDDIHERMEVSVAEGGGSKQIALAGLKWTLSVYRNQRLEKETTGRYIAGFGGQIQQAETKDVMKDYFGVRLEPALDNEGRDFEVRVTGVLRIPRHSDRLHQMGVAGGRRDLWNRNALHDYQSYTKTFSTTLRLSKRYHTEPDMVLVADVTCRGSQFVGRNGKFALEADLRVHSLFVGQFPSLRFGGTRPIAEQPLKQLIRVEKKRSDGGAGAAEAARAGGQPAYTNFYVTKELLAFHSTHFKHLFASDSCSGNITTLTKDKISAKAFRSLLEILHGANVNVKACHVEQLLRFAREYALPVVTAHLEKFLLSRKSFLLHSVKKLELADRYGLVTLKSQLVKRLGVKEDAGKVLDKTDKGRVKYEEALMEQLKRRKEQLPRGQQVKAEWNAVREKRALKRKAKASAKKGAKAAAKKERRERDGSLAIAN